MAIAVSDVISRVKTLFGDEAGVQLRDADIYMWLTDAQREAVAQNTNLLQKRTNGSTVAGTGTIAIPTGSIELLAFYLEGCKLPYLTIQEMDLQGIDWRGFNSRQGRPVAYTREAQNYLLYPIPDQAYQYTILHTYEPTPVAGTSTPLELPNVYSNYLTEFCLMKAYEMDEDWEAAAAKASIVQSTLDALNARDSYYGKDFYPSVTEVS